MAKTIELALKKAYLKMLKAYARGKMNKAKKLERKVLLLELELSNG